MSSRQYKSEPRGNGVATILDSGSTCCVFKDREVFSDYKREDFFTLKIADNSFVRVVGIGTVRLACGIILYECRHYPFASRNFVH